MFPGGGLRGGTSGRFSCSNWNVLVAMALSPLDVTEALRLSITTTSPAPLPIVALGAASAASYTPLSKTRIVSL